MFHQLHTDDDQKNLIEQGFTLVELLIVIVIMGILAGIVVFAVGNLTSDASKNSCSTDAATFNTAFQAYKAHNSGKVAGALKTGGADAQGVIDELVSNPAPAWALANNGGPYLQSVPGTFAATAQGANSHKWTITNAATGATDASTAC